MEGWREGVAFADAKCGDAGLWPISCVVALSSDAENSETDITDRIKITSEREVHSTKVVQYGKVGLRGGVLHTDRIDPDPSVLAFSEPGFLPRSDPAGSTPGSASASGLRLSARLRSLVT